MQKIQECISCIWFCYKKILRDISVLGFVGTLMQKIRN